MSAARGLVILALLCGLACALGSGCSFVKFERSPYAIRGLEVVYSEQEDTTFLIWRLRRSADPSVVSFELYQDGAYRTIDLSQTRFPADPYDCDARYLCFQYQVAGRYQWPVDMERPLRSVHEDEGIYAGSIPREYVVPITFGVEPIGIEKNRKIDPRIMDWFAINKMPMRRNMEWQLVDSSAPYGQGDARVCPDPAGAWSVLNSPQTVDYGWVEQARCMVARPRRREGGGPWVKVPFPPSAELSGETQNYLPPEERPPVLYGYLIDLLIRSSTRCQRAQNTITSTIDRGIGKRAPDAVRLGVFTPTDPETGRPLDGCKQSADQDYPVRQMAEAAKAAAAQLAPQRVKLVWIYMNNVDLPPSERVLLQLQDLEAQSLADNVELAGWGIGSNVIGQFGWSWFTGWRSLEDKTFTDDLKSWTEINVPFRTMLHDWDTEVLITRPVEAKRAELFKICDATPNSITGIGTQAGVTDLFPGERYYPWPTDGQPHYTIGLEPQVLVPYEEYVRQTVSVVIEVCERFCDFPFRRVSGQDLPSWSDTGVCQWSR